MSNVCPKCKKDVGGEWCSECDCTADHTCERETNRIKDIKYGYKDRMVTIFIEYCPECGKIFSVYYW
jgi:hypothetical protein